MKRELTDFSISVCVSYIYLMINLLKALRDHPKCVALVPGVLENLKEQTGTYTNSINKKSKD